MPTQEWHDRRRQGIGGSDAPVIYLGEHYGKTPRDLYHEKVDGATSTVDGPDIRRGIRQEPVAAQVFEEKTGIKLLSMLEILEHPKHPWMLASLDRISHEGPVELKCPRLGTFAKWKRAGLPHGHLLQGQHYLAVTGAKRIIFGIFCAEVDEMIIVPVERDDALIDQLTEKEGAFWDLVQARTPPPVTLPGDVEIPPAAEGVITMTSPEWFQAIADLRLASDIAKEGEELLAAAKEGVQGLMQDAQVAEGAGARVYWQFQAGRKTLDKKALLRDHPSLNLEAYQKAGASFRTFRPYLNVRR